MNASMSLPVTSEIMTGPRGADTRRPLPSVFSVTLLPVISFAYGRLARSEERQVTTWFGDAGLDDRRPLHP